MNARRKFFGNFSFAFLGSLFGIGHRKSSDQLSVMEAKKGVLLAENTIRKDYDLIVVGGGISGVSAAVSAARHGVKVALVHNRAMFGGNSSSEVKLFPENNGAEQAWIKEGGIHEELHTEERVRNHDPYLEGAMNSHWDLVMYEWVIREPNISHYLNTHMHQVFMENDSRIDSIFAIQLGTEKSFNLSAPLFVDATGDGVLGKLAGADFRWGREARHEYGESLAPEEADEMVMGNSIFYSAKDSGKPAPFKLPEWAHEYTEDDTLLNRKIDSVEGGFWWNEIGMPYHPIQDNNETRHEGLRQILGLWDYIKNKQPDKEARKAAENFGLDFVGFWPYKRASRRIIGDYVVTQKDLQDPQRLPDAVAHGAWHIDVHVPGGILARNLDPLPDPRNDKNWQELGAQVYDIPIRALYSRKVHNLMMAGRPISCSYLAFASSRVLSTGSICGEAVGIIASLARKHNALPREVAQKHAGEAQQMILRNDGYIPGVENTDENDLARQARITGSGHSPLSFPLPNSDRELNFPYAQLFPVSADRIDTVSLYLRSEVKQSTRIRLALREADHVWDFRAQEDISVTYATIPSRHQGWVDFRFDVDVQPGKFYYVYTDRHPGIYWELFNDTPGLPNRVPVGIIGAYLPDKTSYAEKSEAFKSLFPEVELKDIPGAGKEGHWKPLTKGKALCMKVSPESYPYQPQNVNRGTHRPDKWTNLWISQPIKEQPARLQLEWEQPVECNTIQLTFDTNQNKRTTLPLFRYPECVKDYTIEYFNGISWTPLVEEKGNYVRRRVHTFGRIKTDRIRIVILATNGDETARIYEVRVYNE